jgi:hypothetical protein
LLAWPALLEQGDDGPLRTGAARLGELTIVGVFLGLPAVAAIAVFAIAWLLGTRVLGRFWTPAARFGWAGSLVIGTLIWIVAGAKMAAGWPSIGEDHATTLVTAGAIVAVLAIAVRVERRGRARIPTVSSGEHD